MSLVMRALVADDPVGSSEDPKPPPHDPAELPIVPGDLNEDAYDDMLGLPFAEVIGWRGAS